MTTAEAYIDGSNTMYEAVIQSLRAGLNSIEKIRETQGGALIFLSGNRNKELSATYFPLKTNTHLFGQNDPNAAGIKNDFIKLLCEEHPYQSSNFTVQFSGKKTGGEYFVFNIPAEISLQYDDKSVAPAGDNSYSWNMFLKKTLDGGFDRKNYEQLLFKPGCSKIAIVPLPLLSTPVVLLALDYDVIKKRPESILQLIHTRTAAAISSFFYMQLTVALTGMSEKKVTSEDELVKLFVNKLSRLLIPSSYSINGRTQLYYQDWLQDEAEQSVYALPLLDGKYDIQFQLCSYPYIDFEKPEQGNYPFIHTAALYKAMAAQSSALVCRLFDLLYTQWKILQAAEEKAFQKISGTIDQIDLSIAEAELLKIRMQLEDLKNTGKPAPAVTAALCMSGRFIIDGDDIFLKIGNELLVTKETCRGKSKQIAGFRYLHFILQQSALNNNIFSISANDLQEQAGMINKDVTVPGKTEEDSTLPDTSPADDFLKNAETCANTVLMTLVGIKKQYDDNGKQQRFLTPGSNHDAVLLQGIMLQKNYRQLNLQQYHEPSLELNKISLDELLDYFNELEQRISADNSSKMQEALELADQNVLKAYFQPITGGMIKEKTPEPLPATVANDQQVKESFRAMLDKLKSLKEKAADEDNPEKVRAFDMLFDNLSSAGLILKERSEPVNPSEYKYNQHNEGVKIISWHFN
ncbi:MAG: hypothetical protein QM791_00635 [Ferruginibacter sp.]